MLSLFSAMRALAPFKRLRISTSVWRELTRYLKLKHLLNVAIFYALMVFIYAVIGVNVIGPLTNRCVDVEGLERSANITLSVDSNKCYRVEHFFNAAANETRLNGLQRLEKHLAIPDLHCRTSNGTCSNGLKCLCVEFTRNRVYQADFPHLGKQAHEHLINSLKLRCVMDTCTDAYPTCVHAYMCICVCVFLWSHSPCFLQVTQMLLHYQTTRNSVLDSVHT